MKTLHLLRLLTCLPTTTSASPFYTYTVIAKFGDTLNGFPAQSFKRTVSHNDNGHVVFIAEGARGKAVFLAVPGASSYAPRSYGKGEFLRVPQFRPRTAIRGLLESGTRGNRPSRDVRRLADLPLRTRTAAASRTAADADA